MPTNGKAKSGCDFWWKVWRTDQSSPESLNANALSTGADTRPDTSPPSLAISRTKVLCWINDMPYQTRGAVSAALVGADVVLPTYEYLMPRLPQLFDSARVWVPHSIVPNFALPINPAPINQVRPLMGADLIIVVFAVVVIGGMGSIMGSIVTGFALGILEGLTKYFYPEASNTVVFVIMALVLMVKPNGLFGRA